MSKQASPTVIGAFVVGAVALVVAGVLIFGSGKFFTERNPFVMYFEGAVNGLQVGAPVTFQGVQIGTVTDIRATFFTADFKMRIPVFVEFVPDSIEIVGDKRPGPGETVKNLVTRGMRAQLQSQSMVTGLLFVQLDFYPGAPPAEVRLDPDTKLLEIPTVPTTVQEATQAIRHALEALGQLPLEEIVTDLQETLQGIKVLVNSPAVTVALRSLGKTLTSVDKLVRNIDDRVTPLASNLSETVTDFRKLAGNINGQVKSLVTSLEDTSKAARVTLEQAQGTLAAVAPESPFGYELAQTLEELASAARSLRVLADYLERHPNAVIFGRDASGGR